MSKEIFTRYGADPLALCRDWLAEAQKTEPNDPEAVCLATCDAKGRPSNRMVLLKQIDAHGFKFHTNEMSRKGRDMAENPFAAMCLYWKSLRRQIRIEGAIEIAPETEADAYFATRSIERQIGAWASQQSTPYEKLEDLQAQVKKYEDEFSGADSIPRPPYWKGYRLVPLSIEFWIAQEHRLHTRFVYKKERENWTATWLCP
ncbi:MAG: pyridoxamine 5'-phosphate oxidase [Alphaproteobacteria bacterium]|nr:pyridoxamine 5'-phosphate oxidase [Alphaproteobacteria bacterium]